MQISRRNILKVAGFLTLETILAGGCTAGVATSSLDSGIITFEQAKADKDNRKGYRTKYVEQIFQRLKPEYGAYIEEIVYDGEQKGLLNEAHDYANEAFKNESEEFRREVAEREVKKSRNEGARTWRVQNQIGTHKKSKIFVFDGIFDDVVVNTKSGEIYSKATEETFLSDLFHEKVHAEGHFNGVSFLGGKITSKNIGEYNFFPLIDEIEAYTRQVERARKSGNANTLANAVGKFAVYLKKELFDPFGPADKNPMYQLFAHPIESRAPKAVELAKKIIPSQFKLIPDRPKKPY